ncbi:MAG: multidrug effflux MFS transporter [Rhodocyclaceae bacterium]|nr:multidrug effflux MFS transporter [Rhodocyclaceae bacterium]
MEPSLRLLAVLLAALTAIGPFSIDTYLPAFPAIGAGLAASPLEVQQTLTAYMLPFTLMTLWHGPLSDALGRRRVILVGMVVFGLASLWCMAATSIQMLWLGRALQGMSSGAGIVVGRAVIRDLLHGADAQRLMAHVAVMFALAPAVAPVLGGWIYTWFGWRAVFGFLALLALLLTLLCWRYLPETLPLDRRHGLHPALLGRSYLRVFGSGAFLLLSLAVGFNFGGFFVYVLSAPVFLIRHLGLSAHEFAWLFVPAVAGMMGGSFLSGHLAGKLSTGRTLGLGYGLMAVAAAANLAVSQWLAPGLPQSVLPIALYNLGMALTMPSLTLLALDLFPAQRGMASSCQSFLQSALTSVSSGIIVPLLWGSPFILALGMAAYLALGLVAAALYRRVRN